MSTPARVDVPVILSGWTYIGGATLHLVVGLPDTDARLLRASDVADAEDDLGAVLASLDADPGQGAGPAYVGTAPTDRGPRVVARGPVWAQLDGDGDPRVLVPGGGALDEVVDEVGGAAVRTVRLRVGAPPAPGALAVPALAVPAPAPAVPVVPVETPAPAPAPAASGDGGAGPRGWLTEDDPDPVTPAPVTPPAVTPPPPAPASPFATLPRWGDRAPVLATPPTPEPTPEPTPDPLEHTLHDVAPVRPEPRVDPVSAVDPVPAVDPAPPAAPFPASTAPDDPPPDFGLDQLFWGTVQRSEYLRRLEHEEQTRAEEALAAEAEGPVEDPVESPEPVPAHAPDPVVEEPAPPPAVVDSPAVRPAPEPADGGLLISSTPWSRRDGAAPAPTAAPTAAPTPTPASTPTPVAPAPPPPPVVVSPAPSPAPAGPRFYSGSGPAVPDAPEPTRWGPTAPSAPTTPTAPTAPTGDVDDTDEVDDRTHARSDLLGVPVAGPTVLAVRCPQGHPNPPYAGSCRACGAPVPDQQPVRIARPPLGVLRLSSGDTVTLDRGVLLGRAPRTPDVPAGDRPHVVKVASPRKDVSRTHLEVTLDEWQVLVRDLQTTNGTTVALPGQAPVLLRSDEPRLIEPGTRISLADEVEVTFEVER
ncbi:FHA domain-containing protein [Lapillicoccus jejuensis]|uniref:FHA domain-containing protein n=1 Tax=Lapillicoccus jejuensis TaxID=402171 RepID=UPI0011544DBC|nr:FHA domain-containing protein [Lapillicoccus jejuensis]